MTGTPVIDICVCTFRRSELADTLRSLAAMDMPRGYRIGIVVADNDEVPSAEALVAGLAHELSLPVRYVHCPARNISLARNACLDASTADFVAFIDDDEKATGSWLKRLVETAQATSADVVLGPVKARYGEEAPGWMQVGDFHSTYPVFVQGEIRTGYTCNALLSMGAPSIAGRRFSLERGRSGGEDTEFFDQVHGAGGRIAYAPEAWVEEPVPASRASFAWLSKRRFRVGQTHGRLLASKRSGVGRAGELARASAKAGYCFAAAGLTALQPVSRNRSLLRGVMHVGVLSGLVGARELQLYGSAGGQDAA
ncbi:glycosyltransferase family 2 protein [Aminobacter anthyllidis]|uniref:glycosyltransferase n=1 Tax=Aminobacter anthyllidis TaxID=1035067 RepID=UPI0024584D9B|nr:glycosyltransferase family 2 protein [Aminobacter anthyllidis]MDH4987366.1 glycosyltransferase family 2 protein [Aminobacter anthyllidis]